MPLQETSGNVTTDAYGGGVAAVPQYIEDVFSTYLYTGNSTTGGTQTITNNIDLSTKGGMVWIKGRSAASSNILTDTIRGAGTTASNNQALSSNLTTAEDLAASYDFLSAFNTTGFAVTQGGTTTATRGTNYNAVTYASWTFRKQPKFFDVVTYTATGSNQVISHSLGSTPGFILIKKTSATGNWWCSHRSLTDKNTYYLNLNATDAQANNGSNFIYDWTSSSFSVASGQAISDTGATYVAYIFAHNAGGFGLTGTDNVISCGSFATNGSGVASVNLGYEPQWLLFKSTNNSTFNWYTIDNMRGWTSNTTGDTAKSVYPNVSDGEQDIGTITITPTGFTTNNANIRDSNTYIYIAIRRGPMKVPTVGTSVFGLNARTGTGANATVTGGQIDDAVLVKNRGSAVGNLFASRLTGTGYLETSATTAEVAAGTTILQSNPWDVMDGVKVGTTSTITNASANTYINYLFKRAPSFFDEVCYTGTGSAGNQIYHNLAVIPEMIIIKARTGGGTYPWWSVLFNFTSTEFNVAYLNTTDGGSTESYSTTSSGTTEKPTSTYFKLSSTAGVNGSASTFVAYLFATCAGVSKVGSYTGNGTTQTIDCGLTAGARFVLIKRTDSTGDWYTYDTARGMTTLTDPYWLTNTTAAEVATLGSVTTVSTGFAVNATILSAINTNAASYIFLAIA
jgi:hypothetical protein